MTIPLEIVTMLGSGILGGVMSLWGQSIKAKQAAHQMMIAGLAQQQQGWQAAMSHPEYQITRRVIAISAVLSIIVLPKLAAMFFPDLLVTVGYTEWNPGFWFFTEGVDAVKWHAATGLVITPLDTHMVAGIVGFYFGNKVGR